jgi:hypothetical protein
MISSKRKIILDKTSIKTIALDILLGLGVGGAISLLLFLGFYWYKGAADPLEILPMFFVLIFINTPYSYLFRIVILVPIYAPVISILLTRSLVQRTTSRKSWIHSPGILSGDIAWLSICPDKTDLQNTDRGYRQRLRRRHF